MAPSSSSSEFNMLKSCGICLNDYDIKNELKTPRLVPCQKHSVCSLCLFKLIREKNGQIECPFDKEKFNAKIKSIPKNLFIIAHLEQVRISSARSATGSSNNEADLSSINLQPRACTIVLTSEDREYGFDVANKSGDAAKKYYISYVVANSAAARSGLQVGDRLLKVNDVSVGNLTHSQVVGHIKSSRVVRLEVQADIFAFSE